MTREGHSFRYGENKTIFEKASAVISDDRKILAETTTSLLLLLYQLVPPCRYRHHLLLSSLLLQWFYVGYCVPISEALAQLCSPTFGLRSCFDRYHDVTTIRTTIRTIVRETGLAYSIGRQYWRKGTEGAHAHILHSRNEKDPGMLKDADVGTSDYTPWKSRRCFGIIML